MRGLGSFRARAGRPMPTQNVPRKIPFQWYPGTEGGSGFTDSIGYTQLPGLHRPGGVTWTHIGFTELYGPRWASLTITFGDPRVVHSSIWTMRMFQGALKVRVHRVAEMEEGHGPTFKGSWPPEIKRLRVGEGTSHTRGEPGRAGIRRSLLQHPKLTKLQA